MITWESLVALRVCKPWVWIYALQESRFLLAAPRIWSVCWNCIIYLEQEVTSLGPWGVLFDKYLSDDECVTVAYMLSKYSSGLAKLLVSLSKYVILWIAWNIFWLKNVSQDHSWPLHAYILPWRHWACRSTAQTAICIRIPSLFSSLQHAMIIH